MRQELIEKNAVPCSEVICLNPTNKSLPLKSSINEGSVAADFDQRTDF